MTWTLQTPSYLYIHIYIYIYILPPLNPLLFLVFCLFCSFLLFCLFVCIARYIKGARAEALKEIEGSYAKVNDEVYNFIHGLLCAADADGDDEDDE